MNGPKSKRSRWVSALVCNWVRHLRPYTGLVQPVRRSLLIAIDLFHGFRQPYMGILIYLIIPSFVWIGLMLAGVERGGNSAAAKN